MSLIPVPGHGAGTLTPEGNLAAFIDSYLLPGKMYRGTWDPEGLFSTLPAIATTLLGVFAGNWIRSGRDRSEIAAGVPVEEAELEAIYEADKANYRTDEQR